MSLKLPKFFQENNLYNLLEVENFSSGERVRRGYRVLALKYHPDRMPDCRDSARKFSLGAQAYRILNDPELRPLYDRFLKARLKSPVPFKSRQLLRQRQKGFRQGYSQQTMVDQDYNSFIDECRHNFRQFLDNLDQVKARPRHFSQNSMEPADYQAMIEEGRSGFRDFLEGIPRVRRIKG